MKFAHCPICQSKDGAFFTSKSSYLYFRCKRCHHLFLDPFPSEKVLKTLYAGDYEFRVDDLSLARFKSKASKIIRRQRHLNPSGNTLLDIGAGYGTFVKSAVSNGLDAIGIEPARNLHRASRSKRIIHTDLSQFVIANARKFDFITAIHIIEHMRDPRSFLTTVMKLLSNRGVLYIETPNSESHLSAFEKGNYTFLTPPDHINLFSMNSLQLLLNIMDSSLTTEFSTYSYPEHFVGILRTIKNGDKGSVVGESSGGVAEQAKLPFFDRVVAPLLTPLLNIRNRGSFLQVFIKKQN